MHKGRLEALSDGAFSIILTLLVIEIRVPEHLENMTNAGLWEALQHLAPLFLGYIVSFLVIAMFWISHNFFFGFFIKNIDRPLVGFNFLYLFFLALVPFSAHLLGRYVEVPVAVLVYGLNVLAIGLTSIALLQYAIRSHEIDTSHNSPRLIAQARVRQWLTVGCTLLGMLVIPISISATLFLYAFPVVFNVIPGYLNKLERLFGFRLGGEE
jgi:uncharacterized membrane protein